MGGTRLFVVALAALLFAAFLASCDATGRSITTTFFANQTTGQTIIGANLLFTCRAVDVSFFRSGDGISFYKRQTADAAWVKIGDGPSPSNRYREITMEQARPDAINKGLAIDNFQAADVGTYQCRVSLAGTTEVPGTPTAEISLNVAPQPATVSVTSSAEAQQDGTYLYDSHSVTTTCTVELVSETDVQVKVLYNNGDHTHDFLVSSTSSWMGSVNAVKEPHRRITLTSLTFKPVSRTPGSVQCVAVYGDDELGRDSITVALKTLPTIQCKQSGQMPAYLNDLDVMITCEAHDYDWVPTASHFSWSFVYADGDDTKTVTLDDLREGKADRRIVEDPKSGKHSLLINKITSDTARYTVYNISLKENNDVVLTVPFTLNVLNKSRSSESGSSSTTRLIPATALLAVSLALVNLLLAR